MVLPYMIGCGLKTAIIEVADMGVPVVIRAAFPLRL